MALGIVVRVGRKLFRSEVRHIALQQWMSMELLDGKPQ